MTRSRARALTFGAFMAELLREAADEMTSAAAWYEAQREGLGDRFLDVVRATILRVDATPRAGAPWLVPKLAMAVRRRSVPGFPFFLVYTTEPEIVIVAIAHMRRAPAYWRARLKR